MSFYSFLEKLEARMHKELPASVAHEPLRARTVAGVFPKFEHKLPPKLGSVLILLYEESGTIKFPLIRRSIYAGAHSGQVSLPGGKVEPGEDAIQAALREAEEEIGVNRNDVQVIGKLSNFDVLPSNFLVTPVVATIKYVPVFIPDLYEVDRIIEADLHALLNDSAIQEKEILAAGIYPMIAPHFLVQNEIVWGATAMMLNELRVIAREFES